MKLNNFISQTSVNYRIMNILKEDSTGDIYLSQVSAFYNL